MDRKSYLSAFFWAAVIISGVPLFINFVMLFFGQTVTMSVWLTSFVFLAFGYGISSFQSGAKLFLSPMRTRPRIIVYLAIIAIFVILLPIMAALAQVDAIQVDWKQFALVAPINIVLLRCAYLIDVTHTVRLIAPLEEEDTVL